MTGSEQPQVSRSSTSWPRCGPRSSSACEQLDAEQWGRPTDCPGWTVKDHLSHLIGIEHTLLGDPAPPPLDAVPAHVTNPFGADERGLGGGSPDVPGAEVLAEFVETTNRRIDALSAMAGDQFDDSGMEPGRRGALSRVHGHPVLDCWAHEQDIRRALDRPGGRNGAGEACGAGPLRADHALRGGQAGGAAGRHLGAVRGDRGHGPSHFGGGGGRPRLAGGRANRRPPLGDPDHGPGGLLATVLRTMRRPKSSPTRGRCPWSGRRTAGPTGPGRHGLHDLTPSSALRGTRRSSTRVPMGRKVGGSGAGTLGYSYASHSRARGGQQGPPVRRGRRGRDRRSPRRGHEAAGPGGPGPRVPSGQGAAAGPRGPHGRSRGAARRGPARGASRTSTPGRSATPRSIPSTSRRSTSPRGTSRARSPSTPWSWSGPGGHPRLPGPGGHPAGLEVTDDEIDGAGRSATGHVGRAGRGRPAGPGRRPSHHRHPRHAVTTGRGEEATSTPRTSCTRWGAGRWSPSSTPAPRGQDRRHPGLRRHDPG